MSRARPVTMVPGSALFLPGPNDAVVLASGVLAMSDGFELRRGAMIGPVGEDLPGAVAVARTPARAWALPAVAGLPLLVGARAAALADAGPSSGPGRAPSFGAHPPGEYPPLAAPPGPPPATADDDTDKRYERRLWWLLILLLLFALLLTGSNLLPGPAWAEMPSDRALLDVTRGRVTAVVDGSTVQLRTGDQVYVHHGDQISVDRRSTAQLTFRGGSLGVLCAETDVQVGELVSDTGRIIQPTGNLELTRGRLLADTHPAVRGFQPLKLTLTTPAGDTRNDGPARLAADPGSTDLSTGKATLNGTALEPTGDELTCGDGVALPKVSGSPTPWETPSDSPSPSETPSESPTPGPTTAGPVPTTPGRTTRPPTTRPPTTGPPPTTSQPPPPPPDITPPVISDQGFGVKPTTIWPTACLYDQDKPHTATVFATVVDRDDPPEQLHVGFTYVLDGKTFGPFKMSPTGNSFVGTIGPFTRASGVIPITIHAVDDNPNNAVTALTRVAISLCTVG
jgi:putative peptide zinc metalloprotease protein